MNMSSVTKLIRSNSGRSKMQIVKDEFDNSQLWDRDFIRKHDIAGPRYTSYPTALQFHEEFTVADYRSAVNRSNVSRKPLSVYVHLPFCESLCYYCACNKVVTANKDTMRRYLDLLIQEIKLRGEDFEAHRPVYQMHWGGGTPTYYDSAEMTELMYELGRAFHLVDKERAEYSVEIDPRNMDIGKLGLLKGLGFNRLSFGIQDFDEKVQKSINRVQPFNMVRDQILDAKAYGFNSINFDLIYGLPHQTVESFGDTITKVIDMDPDRISVFNYAHLPERFKAQGQLPEEALPSADEKLQLFCSAAKRLTEAGYVYIGMDHFAKPMDELSLALKSGQLHRNFQGYTTGKDADLIGVGVSAISQINNVYCQNTRSIRDYHSYMERDELPIQYGVVLVEDDEIRRDVIMEIICNNKLEIAEIERAHGIVFQDYFKSEMAVIAQYATEGLVEQKSYGFRVTPRGHLVVRKICMVFDHYLPGHLRNGKHFSRII